MYQPKYPPVNPDAAALAAYLFDELQAIAQASSDKVDTVQLNVLHAAPKKPREGMVVVADGTDFNPNGLGTGGFFGYFGGAWVKLNN